MKPYSLSIYLAIFLASFAPGANDPGDESAVPKASTAGVRNSGREMRVTAADRRFWSFRPLDFGEIPNVLNERWCRTPIDRFVLSALQSRDIEPNPTADRRVLIRRACFDLIGLPPAPAEVDRFLTDDRPGAWPRLIDELLSSHHYGERWARHWMDVARFAESGGFEHDDLRPNAYHYRDFLIQAFNADMPYDQFLQWQLAGDELAPDQPLAQMATGFLSAGVFPSQLTEAEFESARYDELDDMSNTTCVAFLGLSVGCARCHDHKYDPIPSRDYYRLSSTFTKTIRSEASLSLDPANPDKLTKVLYCSEGVDKLKHHADGRGYPHFYEHTYLLNRGDVNQKFEVVDQGFLQVLTPSNAGIEPWRVPPRPESTTSFQRASLANWMTDPQSGAGQLAARVIVNRLWHYHFGRGIVSTPNDFGSRGARPTHPALLDWLANDLIRHGWKLKRTHKLIMTSSVYMQSGQTDAERLSVDPDNIYLWKRDPRRLEAEAIRDAMLAVTGSLDRTMFGPGTLDPNSNRRSIYFTIKRSELIGMMMLFDWPEHLVSVGRRATTTIAPQALMFMNSPQGRRYAETFADRLPGDLRSKLDQCYVRALGRHPTAQEMQTMLRFFQLQRQARGDQQRADRLALIDLCQTLLSANEFVYVD